MRVSRRTRPSQVGFAASIGRRRLLQTFDTHPARISNEPLSTDGLHMVIRLDFSSTEPAIVTPTDAQDGAPGCVHPAVAAASSARGR